MYKLCAWHSANDNNNDENKTSKNDDNDKAEKATIIYSNGQCNNEVQAAWLVQCIVNMVSTACIYNKDSSGNNDYRYKQQINTNNICDKNYNDEFIAQ